MYGRDLEVTPLSKVGAGRWLDQKIDSICCQLENGARDSFRPIFEEFPVSTVVAMSISPSHWFINKMNHNKDLLPVFNARRVHVRHLDFLELQPSFDKLKVSKTRDMNLHEWLTLDTLLQPRSPPPDDFANYSARVKSDKKQNVAQCHSKLINFEEIGDKLGANMEAVKRSQERLAKIVSCSRMRTQNLKLMPDKPLISYKKVEK